MLGEPENRFSATRAPLRRAKSKCLSMGLVGFLIAPVALVDGAENAALLSHQGVLKKSGTNLNDTVNIVFKIFAGETNGVCIYEESQQVVVTDGLYSTFIGKNPSTGNLEDAAKIDGTFLELTVNGTVLSPRERFSTPPFARRTEERWNLAFYGYWDYLSPGLTVDFTKAQVGQRVDILNPTNCIHGFNMCVFPVPAAAVRITSAKALITTNQNWWAHPDADPSVLLRLTARSFTNSVRTIGPDLVLTPTNSPTLNSWFNLPLGTNQTDLILQESEFLCLELHGAYAGTPPDCLLLNSSVPSYLMLDVRVR